MLLLLLLTAAIFWGHFWSCIPACGNFNSLAFVLNNLAVLSLTNLIALYFCIILVAVFISFKHTNLINFFFVQKSLQKRFVSFIYLKVTHSSVFFIRCIGKCTRSGVVMVQSLCTILKYVKASWSLSKWFLLLLNIARAAVFPILSQR